MGRSVFAASFLSAGLLAVALSAQQPTFRSSVDLIAVEVQVVDDTGAPIPGMRPENFDVSLNGRRRRVVSADFTRFGAAANAAASSLRVTPESLDGRPRRTYMIAVDTSSFEVGAARAPLDAAKAFLSSLHADDLIGFYSYPNGFHISPSTDRALVRQRLGEILGAHHGFGGLYHLRPSEVVDITATSAVANSGGLAARVRTARDVTSAQIEVNPVLGVQQRECPDDPECGARIISEANATALHLEGQAAQSLGGLENLLRSLADVPGRKTVVLISAGVVVTDRPGGRPDVGDLSRAMGHMAAAANATLYTIHIDPGFSRMYSASARRTAGTERDRDRALTGGWLDHFSAAAGGMRIHVPVGAGEFAFDRVLRETSAVYLLGVEPATEDRDGRPRELRVKVNNTRGSTVRNRQWVVVPKG